MIDTRAIRNIVLDLAIRGKLTEQLAEDGDAVDLYAKMQEEKSRLVKEGKIKKKNLCLLFLNQSNHLASTELEMGTHK